MTRSDSDIDCVLFAQFPLCATREDSLAQAGVFAATLAPGLRAQSNQDFILVIAHDPGVSVVALRRLENVLGAVETVFSSTGAPISEHAVTFLQERAEADDARSFVVSVDVSDLAPAPGYVAALRAEAEDRVANRARRALLVGGESLEVNLMLWRMRSVRSPECDNLGAAYLCPLDVNEETIYDYMIPLPTARARELGVDIRRMGANLALRNRSRAADATRPRHLRDLQGPRSASLGPEILAAFSIDETDATHAAENESWLTPPPPYFRRGVEKVVQPAPAPAPTATAPAVVDNASPVKEDPRQGRRAALRKSAMRLWRSLMRQNKVA